MDRIAHLQREIAKREAELADLRCQLDAAESEKTVKEEEEEGREDAEGGNWKWPLEAHHYERYSRQMIVPGFGLQAQLRINKAKVLLVGAGGLGCPAAAYLAGAGVGVLGLVDGDDVEVSNLHRQIAHSTGRVRMSKVESAIAYLKQLNPSIAYRAHRTHLTPRNAEDIVSQYDVVLDCTDHPASRYLVSDACALLRKPLVSASAFQTSGQLVVLNSPPGAGPCYRCVFPRPPPPESVVGCGEGGIVGPVVGVMGVLQALEAIKLIARGGLEGEDEKKGEDKGEEDEDEEKKNAQAKQATMMLLFSGMGDASFRSVRMRGKRPGCLACSGDGTGLTLQELKSSLDYAQFCGIAQPVQLLQPEERITAQEYERIAQTEEKENRNRKRNHLLLDVREKEHFDVCNLEGSVNVPISRFTSHRPEAPPPQQQQQPDWIPGDLPPDAPIYIICRVGNDSQIAAKKLKELGLDRNGERFIGDIRGGMRAWKEAVDPSLPFI